MTKLDIYDKKGRKIETKLDKYDKDRSKSEKNRQRQIQKKMTKNRLIAQKQTIRYISNNGLL